MPGEKRSEVALNWLQEIQCNPTVAAGAHSADTISDPAIPISPTEQPWDCCLAGPSLKNEAAPPDFNSGDGVVPEFTPLPPIQHEAHVPHEAKY